jgi:hypothetical protein
MNIYLTTTTSVDIAYNSLAELNYPNTLISYAYKRTLPNYERIWESNNHNKSYNRIILDSGAFTAFTLGKPVDLREYADWVKKIKSCWGNSSTSLIYMNLDVIGDQGASMVNQTKLESLGINPIPIFTFGADLKILKSLLKDYKYIALGGLVKRKAVKPWLDKCYKEILKYREKTGTLTKTHLLGVCSENLLMRYPCYSSDSSGWNHCLIFGRSSAMGISGSLPKFKESANINKQALLAEIKAHTTLQYNVTKLWESRGIIWND